MQPLIPPLDPSNMPLMVQVVGAFVGLLILAGIGIDLIILVLLRLHPVTRPDLRERLAVRPWHGRDVVFVVLVLLSTFLAIHISLQVLLAMGLNAIAEMLTLLQAILFQLATLLAVGRRVRQRGVSWRVAFGIGEGHALKRVTQGVVFYLAALPVVTFYAIAAMAILEWLGVPPARQAIIEILDDPSQPLGFQLYLVMLAIVGAPITEELLFRGMALPALARRYHLTWAMVLTSLVFALVHVTPAAILPLFAFGMALSLGYAYTGSLLVPMVMHACFNTVSITMLALLRIGGVN